MQMRNWMPCRRWEQAALAVMMMAPLVCAWGQSSVSMEIRLMAASCAACHGHEGRSTGVGLPLAGQTAEVLSSKLLGFKSGQIPGTVMQQHAKGYSDDELKRLAQYFSQLKAGTQ